MEEQGNDYNCSSKTFKEQVLDSISVKKVLIKFPIEVYQKLDEYARENSTDCYWLAIKQLLDEREKQQTKELQLEIVNRNFEYLKEKVDTINNRLYDVEDKVFQEKQTEDNDKKRTFGE